MSSDEDLTLITKLANFTGTAVPAFRLLLSIILGYPLAVFYHKSGVFNLSKNLNHLFFAICGLIICYFNYGIEVYHSVIAVIASYLFIQFLGRTKYLIPVTFIFHMTHLLGGYYTTETNDYDIKWTMPHCVLVLRLIGLSFDISDGQQPDESLSLENKKTALTRFPNILELAGFTFFPASFLTGPQFPFRRYENFANKEYQKYTQNFKIGFRRGAIGAGYLVAHQIGMMFISDNYMISPEYDEKNILVKLTLLGLWGKFTLYKYIACWLISEGVATCFGLTFVSKDEKTGEEDWSGCANIKLMRFETAGKMHHYIESFNVNTNHWVAQYIFKRLRFLGNRYYSHIITLLFLAVWHGFHNGYYACFFFEFLMVIMEKDLELIIKNNDTLTNFFQIPTVNFFSNIFTKYFAMVSMGWSLIPFVLLHHSKWWPGYATHNYYGFIVYMAWPFIWSPILRTIFKSSKPKEKRQHTE